MINPEFKKADLKLLEFAAEFDVVTSGNLMLCLLIIQFASQGIYFAIKFVTITCPRFESFHFLFKKLNSSI